MILLIIGLLATFLPNRFDHILLLDVAGVPIPLSHIVLTGGVLLGGNLSRGCRVFWPVPLILVYALLQGIFTESIFTPNGISAFWRGFVPPLCLCAVVGAYPRLPKLAVTLRLLKGFLYATAVYAVAISFFRGSLGPIIGWASEPTVAGSGLTGFSRISMPFGGPTLVGSALAFVFPIFLARAVESKNLMSHDAMVAGMLAVLIVLTFSRGPFLLLCFGIVSTLFLVRKKRLRLVVITLLLICSIVVSGLLTSRVFRSLEIDPVITRESSSDTFRYITYATLLKQIVTNPLGTGVGSDFLRELPADDPDVERMGMTLISFGGETIMSQAHSTWLLLLSEVGWLGALLFFYVFVRLVQIFSAAARTAALLNHKDYELFFKSLMASSIGLILWLAVSDSLLYFPRFAILIWLLLGLFAGVAMNYTAFVRSDHRIIGKQVKFTPPRPRFA